jgi:hypothetical protein
MAAPDLQRALTRLYTDHVAQEAFLAGDDSFLAPYALSASELLGLARLRTEGRRGFEFFTSMLAGKRSRKVKAFMPLTRAALRRDYWERAWTAYCRSCRPEVALEAVADAQRFAAFLLGSLSSLTPAEPLVRDILVYESCQLQVASAAPRAAPPRDLAPSAAGGTMGDLVPRANRPYVLQLLSHDLSLVIPEFRATGQLPKARPGRFLFLFYWGQPPRRVKVAKVSPGVAAVLDRCDGRQTVEQILRRIIDPAKTGASRAWVGAEEVLRELVRRGVVSLGTGEEGLP